MSGCAMAPRLEAARLAGIAGISHGFFTRAGGVSGGVYASLNAGIGSGDAAKNVAANRARMAAALGVAPDCLLTCYQIHSATAVSATAPWDACAAVWPRPRADAIVTRTPGLAIGISTADCAPVLLADPAPASSAPPTRDGAVRSPASPMPPSPPWSASARRCCTHSAHLHSDCNLSAYSAPLHLNHAVCDPALPRAWQLV